MQHMKGLKKCLILPIALSLVIWPLPLSAAPVYERLSGITQYDTAVEIAKAGGAKNTAVIAVGTPGNSYDALAAAPLAAAKNAPLLLTEGNQLTAVTQTALKDLAVKNVYLIGGTGVIKSEVEDAIKKIGITVTRLAGFDAAETSVKIAQVIGVGAGSSVVLAGGKGQDALSIAPVAAAKGMPILYTTGKNTLPSSVAQYIAGIKSSITTSYIVGGTGVISEAQAGEMPGQIIRLAGTDAYDTNVAVIQGFADQLDFTHVYLANGETMVDALAGAPLAAAYRAPLVLTDNKAVKAAALVNDKLTAQSSITALGGTAVIAQSTLYKLTQSTTEEPGSTPLSIDIFKAVDRQTFKVILNHSVADPDQLQWKIEQQGKELKGFSLTWNQAKTEVLLAFTAPLADGSYTVKASGATFFTNYDTASCNLLTQSGVTYSIVNLSPIAGFKDFTPDITETYAERVRIQAMDANHNVYEVDPRDILSVTSADQSIATTAQVKNDWYVAGRNVATGGNTADRSVKITAKINTLNGVQTIEQTAAVSPKAPEVQEMRTGYWRINFPTRNLDLSGTEQTHFEFNSVYDALSGRVIGVFGLDQYGVWRDLILDQNDVVVKDTQYAPSNAFIVFLDNTISIENKDIFRLRNYMDGITKNVDIRVILHYEKAVKEVTVKILAP